MLSGNKLIEKKFKDKIVRIEAGEFLFKYKDALDVIEEINRIKAIILGLDFWKEVDDGIMEINSTAWDDINSGPDASSDTVREARKLLKNQLPDNADYVSFVLTEPKMQLN
jgi:hypothetical protein